MSDEKPTPETTPQKGWGIHIAIPHGELTDEQAAKLHESVNKLMPHFVETIAKAHGIDASGANTDVTRPLP